MSSQIDERVRRLEILLDLERDKVRRLQDDVARLAQQNRVLASASGAGGGGGGASFVGYAATTVAARSGATLGLGSVAIYTPAGGVLTSTGVTVAVYSVDDAAIVAGTLCAVTTIAGVNVATRLECAS